MAAANAASARTSRAPGATSRHPGAASDLPLGAAAQVLAEAEAAYHAGQAAKAIRHLKLLSAMSFEDPLVQKRAHELRQQVLRAAAFRYEKEAAQAEKLREWDKAAKAWLNVAEGRPTESFPLQRAALAQLQAGGDLRTAVETAKRAVQVAPSDAEAHRTLAEVYLAADMHASARSELEAAQRCSPEAAVGEEASPTGLLKRLLGTNDRD